MFNITNLLNTLDNAAKERLHDDGSAPQMSATLLRSAVKEAPGVPGHVSGAGNGGGELASVEESDAEALDSAARPSATELQQRPESKAVRATSVLAPSSSSSSSSSSSTSVVVDAEIERLNGECLELEEQAASLKTEVQEAWNTYQAAQEKAAAREAELQEEIRALQKAKKTDKQQMLAQLTTLDNDREEALRGMRAAQAERQEALDMLENERSRGEDWLQREKELLSELSEARAGSIQGVQGLRDELRAAAALSDQLRSEHASLLRQSQKRQAELEEANAELVQGLAEKQRELLRAKAALEAGGRDEASAREVESLQSQARLLGQQLEDEREKRVGLECRTKQVEYEHRAASLNWEDERSRLEARVSESATALRALEDKLKGLEHGTPLKPRAPKVYGGGDGDGAYVVVGAGSSSSPGSPGSSSGGSGGGGGGDSAAEEIKNLVAQVQNLSKQLLSKQSAVNELQAERSALKSRLHDLQARCASSEKQLAALRDLEEDDFGADRDRADEGVVVYGGSSGFGSSSYGLQHRRKAPQSTKVMADLEKLGVRTGPGIASVVDKIDMWTLGTGK